MKLNCVVCGLLSYTEYCSHIFFRLRKVILQYTQIAKHIIQTISMICIDTLLMTATFMACSAFHYVIMFVKNYSHFNFQGKQNISHLKPLLPTHCV